jgi:hypothetical protein
MSGKKYRVVEDYQGGSFGMDRDFTAEEWLEQMAEWQDADGCDDEDIKNSVAYWQKKIEDGEEQDLIDYIAEVWTIRFEEVKE